MRKLALYENGEYVTLKSPIRVLYDISPVCNLQCRFCYIDWENTCDHGANYSHPPIEHVTNILSKLRDAGVMDVVTLGGEIFSYSEWFEVIRFGTQIGLNFGIISNGTAISHDIATRIAGYVNSCAISFHAPDAATYEYLVGAPGEFDNVINGLKYLSEAGIKIGILFSPVPKNYLRLYDTIEVLIEEYHIQLTAVQVNRMVPQGRARDNWTSEVFLPLNEFHKIFPQMLHAKNDFGIHVEFGDAFPLCQLEEIYWDMVVKCEYGTILGTIGANGDVRRCPCGSNSIGNMLQKPLSEIWRNSPVLKDYRQLRWLPVKCSNCTIFERCGGGCSMSTPNTEHHSGDLFLSPGPSEVVLPVQEKLKDSVALRISDFAKPKLCTNVRFREDIVGTLCIPHWPLIILERTDVPILIVNDLERKIISLCDGHHSTIEIRERLSADTFMPEEELGQTVQYCLEELGKYGYLDHASFRRSPEVDLQG